MPRSIGSEHAPKNTEHCILEASLLHAGHFLAACPKNRTEIPIHCAAARCPPTGSHGGDTVSDGGHWQPTSGTPSLWRFGTSHGLHPLPPNKATKNDTRGGCGSGASTSIKLLFLPWEIIRMTEKPGQYPIGYDQTHTHSYHAPVQLTLLNVVDKGGNSGHCQQTNGYLRGNFFYVK